MIGAARVSQHGGPELALGMLTVPAPPASRPVTPGAAPRPQSPGSCLTGKFFFSEIKELCFGSF